MAVTLPGELVWVLNLLGFNWPEPDHFRLVTLPRPEDIADAVTRIGDFLSSYAQP